MSTQPSTSDRPLFSYRFGSAEFDESRLELRVAGLPVEVEPRALDLLAYLLRHAGEVVTKEELLREVWANRPTVEKVLPNAILKLRRALGEANAGSIATLPRIGYRLDATVARVAVRRPDVSPLRLAAGDSVPGRSSFLLLRRLGRASVNEVWLAEHGKTRERRVYKFAVEGERLRTLMREVTLLRVLRESLFDQEGFVELIDWNFEVSPFYIECAYGGPDLVEWADQHLSALDVTGRIDLFLQIADAVAAAHSVGVLHKDIKPANILVSENDRGLQVRLADFGSSGVFDSGALESLNITRLGMTLDDSATGSSQGTPLYLAPELVTGGAATVQSDVYALGVVLYQLLSGSLTMPMVSGWEQQVPDPLLQEDLLRATDGHPSRRLSSVTELTDRLRSLALRRARADEQAQTERQAQVDRDALARARARRPLLAALVVTLALAGATALVLQQAAVRARDEARSELERANAISRFLNDELISRANPLISAKGADATLKDVLLAASGRLEATFGGQPRAEHAVRANLASLLNTLELFDDAETQAREAIALAPELGGERSPETVAARGARAHPRSQGPARSGRSGVASTGSGHAGFDVATRSPARRCRTQHLVHRQGRPGCRCR
jgi:non-specific serine/threonine protein kinase